MLRLLLLGQRLGTLVLIGATAGITYNLTAKTTSRVSHWYEAWRAKKGGTRHSTKKEK